MPDVMYTVDVPELNAHIQYVHTLLNPIVPMYTLTVARGRGRYCIRRVPMNWVSQVAACRLPVAVNHDRDSYD